jgi:hypothetical protein
MLIKEDNGNYLGFSAFFLTSETFAPLEISRVVITRSASLPWKAQRRRRRPGRKIAGFGPLGPGSRNPRFRGPKDPKPGFRDLRSRFGVSGVPESGTPVSGGNPEIPESRNAVSPTFLSEPRKSEIRNLLVVQKFTLGNLTI